MGEPANLSLNEAAQWLGVASRTVYRLVRRGQLPGFKVGGQWRFNRRMLESWMLEQTMTRIPRNARTRRGDRSRSASARRR